MNHAANIFILLESTTDINNVNMFINWKINLSEIRLLVCDPPRIGMMI
jgi:hypothetical protein